MTIIFLIFLIFVALWNSCISGFKTNKLHLYLLITDDVDLPSLRTIRVSEPSELGEKAILFQDGIDAILSDGREQALTSSNQNEYVGNTLYVYHHTTVVSLFH